MNRRFLWGGLLVTAGLVVGRVTAQDGSAGGEDLGSPGPEHAQLAKMEGTWDVTVKYWMDPAGSPMTMPGKSTLRPVLGGRFLEERFSAPPFEGLGYVGYDRSKDKFTSVWMDNMSTWTMASEGGVGEDGKVVLTGQSYMPDTGAVETIKMVVTHESDDKSVHHMYRVADGKDVKMMEMTYTRAE